MATLNAASQESTRIESIYRGLCSTEEQRREYIKLIADKVSTLLPIQSAPTCKGEDRPKEKCVITDIEAKIENLEADNLMLRDILDTLRRIV